MRYSTIVGIDTHSKKNAVCAIVPATGEMREAVLSEDVSVKAKLNTVA